MLEYFQLSSETEIELITAGEQPFANSEIDSPYNRVIALVTVAKFKSPSPETGGENIECLRGVEDGTPETLPRLDRTADKQMIVEELSLYSQSRLKGARRRLERSYPIRSKEKSIITERSEREKIGQDKPVHDCTFFPFGFLPFSRAAAAFFSLFDFPPTLPPLRPRATAAAFFFFVLMLRIYPNRFGLSRTA